ncbi:MAG TPA: 30S ribosomal protein S3 [Candidatus Dormibacteraeota bacterium]|nr:30S ribosomal protein S3 [Candidatus Dormibacteraeota bacterium]
MGQKVHPNGFRLGVYRNWDARWFASGPEYTKLLQEDLAMRQLIASRLKNASVARIETERSANQLTVIIHTAKPGIVIGRSGASVDALRDNLERISGKKVRVTIQEIKTPELDAQLLAENVANQLEKRIAFRRAVKQSVMRSMRAGAKGVRIQVSGRLGGGDMSRREWDRDGRVPLHTLRADIDFGQAEAKTTFGQIGVSAWIYRGDFTEPQVAVTPPPESTGEVPTSPAPIPAPVMAEASPVAPSEAPAPTAASAEMVSEGSPAAPTHGVPAAAKPRARAQATATAAPAKAAKPKAEKAVPAPKAVAAKRTAAATPKAAPQPKVAAAAKKASAPPKATSAVKKASASPKAPPAVKKASAPPKAAPTRQSVTKPAEAE